MKPHYLAKVLLLLFSLLKIPSHRQQQSEGEAKKTSLIIQKPGCLIRSFVLSLKQRERTIQHSLFQTLMYYENLYGTPKPPFFPRNIFFSILSNFCSNSLPWQRNAQKITTTTTTPTLQEFSKIQNSNSCKGFLTKTPKSSSAAAVVVPLSSSTLLLLFFIHRQK